MTYVNKLKCNKSVSINLYQSVSSSTSFCSATERSYHEMLVNILWVNAVYEHSWILFNNSLKLGCYRCILFEEGFELGRGRLEFEDFLSTQFEDFLSTQLSQNHRIHIPISIISYHIIFEVCSSLAPLFFPILKKIYFGTRHISTYPLLFKLFCVPHQAYQIFEVLRKVGKFHNFSAGLIIGGKVYMYSYIYIYLVLF